MAGPVGPGLGEFWPRSPFPFSFFSSSNFHSDRDRVIAVIANTTWQSLSPISLPSHLLFPYVPESFSSSVSPLNSFQTPPSLLPSPLSLPKDFRSILAPASQFSQRRNLEPDSRGCHFSLLSLLVPHPSPRNYTDVCQSHLPPEVLLALFPSAPIPGPLKTFCPCLALLSIPPSFKPLLPALSHPATHACWNSSPPLRPC